MKFSTVRRAAKVIAAVDSIATGESTIDAGLNRLCQTASQSNVSHVSKGGLPSMNDFPLKEHEVILKSDSSIVYFQDGKPESRTSELLLTNFDLVVVRRKSSGKIKNITRFPLGLIKAVNGIPQVVSGKTPGGGNCLTVHFGYGPEQFALGQSDEDEEDTSLLSNLLATPRDKEKRNLDDWRRCVTEAATLAHKEAAKKAEPKPPDPATMVRGTHVTRRCIGCMAPISGREGEKVMCRYCDTEQAL